MIILSITLSFLVFYFCEDTPQDGCDLKWICGKVLPESESICSSEDTGLRTGDRMEFNVTINVLGTEKLSVVCWDRTIYVHQSKRTPNYDNNERFMEFEESADHTCFNSLFYIDIQNVKCEFYTRQFEDQLETSSIREEIYDLVKTKKFFFTFEIWDVRATYTSISNTDASQKIFLIVHIWNYMYCCNFAGWHLGDPYTLIRSNESPYTKISASMIDKLKMEGWTGSALYCYISPTMYHEHRENLCPNLKCLQCFKGIHGAWVPPQNCDEVTDIDYPLVAEVLLRNFNGVNAFWMTGMHFLLEYNGPKSDILLSDDGADILLDLNEIPTLDQHKNYRIHTEFRHSRWWPHKQSYSGLIYPRTHKNFILYKMTRNFTNFNKINKINYEYVDLSESPESSSQLYYGMKILALVNKILITPDSVKYNAFLRIDSMERDRNKFCNTNAKLLKSLLQLNYLKNYTNMRAKLIRSECCDLFNLKGISDIEIPPSRLNFSTTFLFRDIEWKINCRIIEKSIIFQPKWVIEKEKEFREAVKDELDEILASKLVQQPKKQFDKIEDTVMNHFKMMSQFELSETDMVKVQRVQVSSKNKMTISVDVNSTRESPFIQLETQIDAEVVLAVVDHNLLNGTEFLAGDMIVMNISKSDSLETIDSGLMIEAKFKLKSQRKNEYSTSKVCQRIFKCSKYDHMSSVWKESEHCATIIQDGSMHESAAKNTSEPTEVFCSCHIFESSFTLSLLFTSAPANISKSLYTISQVGCFISTGLFFFISLHLLFIIITIPGRRNVANYGYFQFSLSFTFLYISFIVASYTNRCSKFCRFTAMLLNYSLLCCFTIMFTIAVNLLRKIVYVSLKQEGQYSRAITNISAWLIPLLFILTSYTISEDSYVHPKSCYATGTYHIITMAVIVPINLFSFGVIWAVALKMRMKNISFKNSKVSRDEIILDISAMLVLGINWLPGCLMLIIESRVLEIGFFIVNSFFGMIFTAFYLFYSKDLHSRIRMLTIRFTSGRSTSEKNTSQSKHNSIKSLLPSSR